MSMPVAKKHVFSLRATMVGACAFGAIACAANADIWTTEAKWTEGQGPDAREHAAFILDEKGDRLLLFGGSGYHPQMRPLEDAWAFDLETKTWASLRVEGDAPSGNGSKRVAHQPGADVAYTFGGYDGGFNCNADLHRVRFEDDALVFELVEQDAAPSARALHAFAHDPVSDRFCVFGGAMNGRMFGDTWIGEANDEGVVVWRELDGEGPEARYGHVYGFEEDSGRMIVFSGQAMPVDQENPFRFVDDVWSIDLRADDPTWTQHAFAQDDAPAGRRNPAFCFDGASGGLIVWCGTADGRTSVPGLVSISLSGDEVIWRALDDPEHGPAMRSSGMMVADPSSGEIWTGFGNSADGTYQDLHRARIASPEPELVGRGKISTDTTVFNTTFTDGGETLIATEALDPSFRETRIIAWRKGVGIWRDVTPVGGVVAGLNAGDGAMSPDENTFVFVADEDMYVTRRMGAGWSPPVELEPHLSSDEPEAYPTLSASGELCFTRQIDGDWEILVAPPRYGSWGEPQRLPDTVNTRAREHDAFITADGSAIIFVRIGDPKCIGSSDLFITHREGDTWSPAKHLSFNSRAIDGSPCVSPDGDWLYFTSGRPAPGDANGTLNIWRVPLSHVR